MGFFDNLLNRSAGIEQFDARESYCGLLLAMIAADGDISDEEVNDVSSLLTKSKLIQSANTSALDRPLKVLRKDGVSRLLELSATGLPDQYRKGAFACVCDLAFSDGEIAAEEQEMLEKLKLALQIDDSTATKTIEVIISKNPL